LFLFEAYTALLRAGTEVQHDEAWKEQVREHKGILLSIDGIQPDKGNDTIYLLRDVFTGRILNADNVTESTKERLKQVLSPVVALGVPVIGVISDAQPTELQAVCLTAIIFAADVNYRQGARMTPKTLRNVDVKTLYVTLCIVQFFT